MEELDLRLRDKLNSIFEELKTELISGNFKVIGDSLFNGLPAMMIDCCGMPLDIRISHREKEAAPEEKYLGWYGFAKEERNAIYQKVTTGGIDISIKRMESEIERMKTELINLKGIRDINYK